MLRLLRLQGRVHLGWTNNCNVAKVEVSKPLPSGLIRAFLGGGVIDGDPSSSEVAVKPRFRLVFSHGLPTVTRAGRMAVGFGRPKSGSQLSMGVGNKSPFY